MRAMSARTAGADAEVPGIEADVGPSLAPHQPDEGDRGGGLRHHGGDRGAAHAPTKSEHEERVEGDVQERRRPLDHHRRPHVAFAGQDRAQEGGEHQEHVAEYDRTEERPRQRHEIGRHAHRFQQLVPPDSAEHGEENGEHEPEQEPVLGGAVGALDVARADVARHHRRQPAAQPERDAEPEEHQRHVERHRRQRLRTEHADEDHVDDHVHRLQRHPDQHRQGHAPHRAARVGDELVEAGGRVAGSGAHRVVGAQTALMVASRGSTSSVNRTKELCDSGAHNRYSSPISSRRRWISSTTWSGVP